MAGIWLTLDINLCCADVGACNEHIGRTNDLLCYHITNSFTHLLYLPSKARICRNDMFDRYANNDKNRKTGNVEKYV